MCPSLSIQICTRTDDRPPLHIHTHARIDSGDPLMPIEMWAPREQVSDSSCSACQMTTAPCASELWVASASQAGASRVWLRWPKLGISGARSSEDAETKHTIGNYMLFSSSPVSTELARWSKEDRVLVKLCGVQSLAPQNPPLPTGYADGIESVGNDFIFPFPFPLYFPFPSTNKG